MGGDLGTAATQVHDQARLVLDFWFGLPPKRHFAKDAALDRTIADRFGGWRDEAAATAATGWRDDPDTLLAAIILLDQFSRNIHRGEATAFAADPIAQELTLRAIGQGWDASLPPERRVFLYMPLMHAEDQALQARSVALFARLGIADNLRFAEAHRDVIERFGRFPSRNAALGRASTAAELAYLARPGAGW